jgi:ABC-type multidrug transport system fused ATPase/permease subunit
VSCAPFQGLDDEPKLKIKNRDYLFSDWIKETRQVNNPNFEPIFVAVDHLSYRVPALPPTRHHRSVFSVVADAVRRFIPEKGPKPIPILDDVSFYLKPGQMTLLLGAPGTHHPAPLPCDRVGAPQTKKRRKRSV